MKDLKGKSEKELQKMLHEKHEASRAFRFGISGSKVRNMKEGRGLRKEVAQIMTELNRKGGEKTA
jgi:ribosomal protein L29